MKLQRLIHLVDLIDKFERLDYLEDFFRSLSQDGEVEIETVEELIDNLETELFYIEQSANEEVTDQ